MADNRRTRRDDNAGTRYSAANATQADRVARLRERVKQAAANDWDETDPLPGILQGMLDLIADGGDA